MDYTSPLVNQSSASRWQTWKRLWLLITSILLAPVFLMYITVQTSLMWSLNRGQNQFAQSPSPTPVSENLNNNQIAQNIRELSRKRTDGLYFFNQRPQAIIDGVAYTFVADPSDPNQQFQLAIEDGVTEPTTVTNDKFLNSLGQFISSRTHAFWFDTDSLRLFLVDMNAVSRDLTYSLIEIQIDTQPVGLAQEMAAASKRYVLTKSRGFAEATEILGYNASQNTLLLVNRKYDTCSGQSIWKLNLKTGREVNILQANGDCGPGYVFGGLADPTILIVGVRHDERPATDDSNSETVGNLAEVWYWDWVTGDKKLVIKNQALLTNLNLESNLAAHLPHLRQTYTNKILLRAKKATREKGDLFLLDTLTESLIKL